MLRVELRICVPQEPVRVIYAYPSNEISVLQTLWPGSPKKFLFDGIELIPTLTFESYGIRQGDSIIALPHSNCANPLSMHEWTTATRDSEAFNDSVGAILNPATTRQVARLRDLNWRALERRPKQFQRLCAVIMETEPVGVPLHPTVIMETAPLAPSEEALPVSWNRDRRFGNRGL
jgi:hypothetical protein